MSQAEQVIQQRQRQHPHFAQGPQTQGTVTLGQWRAALPGEHRHVSILRCLQIQGLQDQQLPRGVAEVIVPPQQLRDTTQRIIDGVGKKRTRRSRPPAAARNPRSRRAGNAAARGRGRQIPPRPHAARQNAWTPARLRQAAPRVPPRVVRGTCRNTVADGLRQPGRPAQVPALPGNRNTDRPGSFPGAGEMRVVDGSAP